MADRDERRLQRPERNPAYPRLSYAILPHSDDPAALQPLPGPSLEQTTFPNYLPTESDPTYGKVQAVESDPRQQSRMADIANALYFGIGGPSAGAGAAVKLGTILGGAARRVIPEFEGVGGRGINLALHSSPHDIERFNYGKYYYTGEGAPGFGGPGNYAAEHWGVSGPGGFYYTSFEPRFSPGEQLATKVLRRNQFDRDAAVEEARKITKLPFRPDDPLGPQYDEVLRLLENNKPVGPRTYVVDIKRKPEELFNWDAQLRNQTNPEVLRIPGLLDKVRSEAARRLEYANLAKLGPRRVEQLGGILADPTGATGEFAHAAMLNPMAMQSGADAARLRLGQELNTAGIPGVVYRDQFSRGRMPLTPEQTANINAKINELKSAADEAKQLGGFPGAVSMYQRGVADLQQQLEPLTNNYVNWHNDIDILKKFGLVGTIGAGTVAGATGGRMGDLATQDNHQPEYQ